MTSLYEEIIKILKEEEVLLTSLYQIVSEERDAIIGLKSSELEKVLLKKEETLMKLSLWEVEREKTIERNNLKGITLNELISYFEEQDKSRDISELKGLFDKMKTLLSSIREIQKINEQLIDRSLIHLGTALKFLENFGIKPKQSLSREA